MSQTQGPGVGGQGSGAGQGQNGLPTGYPPVQSQPLGYPAQAPAPGYPPGQPPNVAYGMPPPPGYGRPPKKRRSWVKWLGIGIIGLVVLGAAGNAARPPDPATLPGVGQPVAVKNWTLTVLGVERAGKTLVWSSGGNKSEAAGTWLVISIELKNTGNTNFGVNTFDFELKDAKGITYQYTSDFSAAYLYGPFRGGRPIFGAQVPPGVAVRNYLVFDVAPTANGLQLVFKQASNPRINLGV